MNFRKFIRKLNLIFTYLKEKKNVHMGLPMTTCRQTVKRLS